jgi:hypothetical protein
MSKNQSNAKKILKELFIQAQLKGGIQYIYTLLRVTGITKQLDPLLKIKAIIKELNHSNISDDDFLDKYKAIMKINDPLDLIANLINCIDKKGYNINPFLSLNKGNFPHIVRPNISERIQFLLKICEEKNQLSIINVLKEAFPEKLVRLISSEGISYNMDEIKYLKKVYKKSKIFFNTLIEIQEKRRLDFLKQPKLHKLPRFEVLELLSTSDFGLYGLKMHFSNGSFAIFERFSNETNCVNITLDYPLSLFVGDIDEMRDEWRIGEKRLYEVGLPGRYNKDGEWKPLVYPGKSDTLQKEASSFSKDPKIKGSFFYMMCTGHRVVEFVICSNLNLPIEYSTFGNKLYLYKCSPTDEEGFPVSNMHIYDGWIELDSIDVNSIKNAIDYIEIVASRLAFTFNCSIRWCVKYNMSYMKTGFATPTQKDIIFLNKIFKNFPTHEDAIILDSAIGWFNHGKNSTNIFTRFLCYYIVLESIAINIIDGKGDFGLIFTKKTKDKKKELKIRCIKAKHEKLYKSDPIEFIMQAYFDCCGSLKSKTQEIIKLIFGDKHEYFKKLFEKEKGESLYDIRGALAHGRLSYSDESHRKIVEERIYDIERIARDLIFRIILRLEPGEKIRYWSGRHTLFVATSDPRSTLVVSDEKIFPNKDWHIRAEWCD